LKVTNEPEATCAGELARLSQVSDDVVNAASVFMDLEGTATAFLQDLSDALGLPERGYVERMLSEWIKCDVIWKPRHWPMSVEELWPHAEQQKEWKDFASLAGRFVCRVPSKSEVERVISIQRDVKTAKASRMGGQYLTRGPYCVSDVAKKVRGSSREGMLAGGLSAADTGGPV
jgi:hypothetical protein